MLTTTTTKTKQIQHRGYKSYDIIPNAPRYLTRFDWLINSNNNIFFNHDNDTENTFVLMVSEDYQVK